MSLIGCAGPFAVRGQCCLLVLLSLVVGIFAYPGDAGLDPAHTHIVIGGTPAERARALALHLLREHAGIDDAAPPAAAGAVAQAGVLGVRVFSVRRNDGSGPAVVSVKGAAGVLAAECASLLAPPPARVNRPARSEGVLQPSLPVPVPPPRSA